MAKNKLVILADELEEVMDKIEALKADIKSLEEREDEIRAELVKGLLKTGLSYVKTTSGMGFGMVAGRVSWKVKDGQEQQAIQWAIAEFPGLLSIASAKLNKVVQPMLNPPEFVERKEGEPHLAVRTTED